MELARDVATYALEDACNTAFVRRRARLTAADRVALGMIALPHRRDVSLVSATRDGAALTADDLAAMRVDGGLISRPDTAGFGNRAEITYEHGWQAPPPRVARAAMLLAREWLQQEKDSTIPDRASALDTEGGNFRLVTAGIGGQLFDLPEVNAVVAEYAE